MSAKAVLQVDGDNVQTAPGLPVPNESSWFQAPVAYAEGLAGEARRSGDVEKARLEDWVDWIVDELNEITDLRADEVAPAGHVADLYDREITVHPPEGFESVNEEDADGDVLHGPDQNVWRVGQPSTVDAAPTSVVSRLGGGSGKSRITILVPPMAIGRRGGGGQTTGNLIQGEVAAADDVLDLLPDPRPPAFDALACEDRAIRGRIFLALHADGYPEYVAWAVALARDVSGVTGPGGFVDISDDANLCARVERRRNKLTRDPSR